MSKAGCLLAVASQHFHLVSLEVVIEAEGPADGMLLQSFCWRVNEGIRENQVVQVELEGICLIIIVIKDGSR